jgi:hypothetical protein
MMPVCQACPEAGGPLANFWVCRFADFVGPQSKTKSSGNMYEITVFGSRHVPAELGSAPECRKHSGTTSRVHPDVLLHPDELMLHPERDFELKMFV